MATTGQLQIRKKTGSVSTAFGVVLAVLGLLLRFGSNASIPLGVGAWILRLLWALLFFGGVRLAAGGVLTRRLGGRLLRLSSLFDTTGRVPLEKAAKTLGSSVSTLVADVRTMQKKRMVEGLYADLLRGELVNTGGKLAAPPPPPAPKPRHDGVKITLKEERRKSVAPLYAMGFAWLTYALFFPMITPQDYVFAAILGLIAFFSSAWSAPEQIVIREVVELPPPPELTGNEALDQLLAGVQEHLADLRRLDEAIDGKLDEPIKDILSTTEQIVAQVKKRPVKAGEMRQFFNYTLPTTIGLLQNYDELARQRVKGKNITDAMEKIEGMFGTIVEAFHRQLDALFADKALNIAVELEVMENMLGQDELPRPGQ